MSAESSGTYTQHPIAHYTIATGANQEETMTEDGLHKYWREALPIPLYVGGGFLKLWQRYECQCGRQFDTEEAYELHYRKALFEEMAYANNHRPKEGQ